MKILCIPDVHSIYQDKKAVEAMKRVGKLYKPDKIIILGDLLDMYSLSRYEKNPERMKEATLKKELKSVEHIIEWVNENSNLPPWYCLGNHERRLETYLLHNAPALYQYKGSNIREMLNLDDYWEIFNYGEVPRIGNIGFTHGDLVRTDAGATALAQRRKSGGSIIQAHSHRLAETYFTDGLGTYVGIESGHLSNKQPVYENSIPNWCQGFTTVDYESNKSFGVDLVPIRNNKAWFKGEWV